MITKEVLSHALSTSTIQMNPIYEKNNMVGYLVYGSQNTPEEVKRNHKQTNIYELSDICKHKITSKFPMFSIKWHPNYVKGTPPACVKVWVQGELLGNQPTEPEAVFQAYQELLTKGLI